MVLNSDKSVLDGNLLEKIKNNSDFQKFRKKVLAAYKSNPIVQKFISETIAFGGNDFFSMNGDTELKLAIGHAYVVATIAKIKGAVTVNYLLEDALDLNYQEGRSAVYNNVNAILKPIWIGLGGVPAMKVEAKWSEIIKK